MKVLEAYIIGWKRLLSIKKFWALFYGLNLLFALVCTLPLQSFLNKTIANSLLVQDSLSGFNFPFLGDFLNQYGNNLSFIYDQSLVVLGLFFLLNLFLVGGLLNLFVNTEKSQEGLVFWTGGAKYFWRLFRLSVYFMLVQGLVLGVFVTVFQSIAMNFSILELTSEFTFINALKIMLPAYLLLATLIAMVHDYAKIHLVNENKNWLTKPVWQSLKIVFNNFRSFFALYLLNIGTVLAFCGLYWLVYSQSAANSMTSITLLFLAGQLFLLSRIAGKITNLASADYLYQERLKAQTSEEANVYELNNRRDEDNKRALVS